MVIALYRKLLRLPQFKGKARITEGYRRTFFSPNVCSIIHGLRIEIDGLEWIQSDILRDGCIESRTCELLGRVLRAGDTYVDVGAHIGLHTLVARHFVGATGTVIAIEPQPYNCHKVLTNWRLNDFENLTLHVGAVGAHDGLAELHLQSPSDTSRLSLTLKPVNDQPQKFYVPISRLETILDLTRPDRIRLLKIDVEGYELATVQGLGKYFDRIDNIVLEILDSEKCLSEDSQSLIQLLSDHNYILRTVEGKPWKTGTVLIENNLWASRNP